MSVDSTTRGRSRAKRARQRLQLHAGLGTEEGLYLPGLVRMCYLPFLSEMISSGRLRSVREFCIVLMNTIH